MKFLNTAQGSLEECRYHIILSKDVNYGETAQLKSCAEEVGRILDGYYNKIARST
jgi:four helix bundle protein